MSRLALGGFKLMEGMALVLGRWPGGPLPLGNLCAAVAARRINLSYLTHFDPAGSVVLCANAGAGGDVAGMVSSHRGNAEIANQITILSVFPYRRRPQVIAALLSALVSRQVIPLGLATSPAAVAALIKAEDTPAALAALFAPFSFPSYRSPADWHAAYRGKEAQLREIIASYQEDIIGTYDFTRSENQALWSVSVREAELETMAAALEDLSNHQAELPFLVAWPQGEGQMAFAFTVASQEAAHLGPEMSSCWRRLPMKSHRRVAQLSLHGPHFGDRHGIAMAATTAIEAAAIPLKGLSCAVSTVSLLVAAPDISRAEAALRRRFRIPTVIRGKERQK